MQIKCLSQEDTIHDYSDACRAWAHCILYIIVYKRVYIRFLRALQTDSFNT